MNPRKEERLYGLKNVVVIMDGVEYPAVIVDISSSGICLRCEKTLPTYREVLVRLDIDGKPVSMKASVRWVHDPIQLKGTTLRESGLSVIDAPEEYRNYLKRILDSE
ncbi:MAG: PilZ domain-containing protein [Acidobacteriota bacterium]|jgi:hypothetical protein|nr:PilZ domain-containing protein [Acidobacteriota bacterium]